MCICKVDKVTNTMSISVGARMSTGDTLRVPQIAFLKSWKPQKNNERGGHSSSNRTKLVSGLHPSES